MLLLLLSKLLSLMLLLLIVVDVVAVVMALLLLLVWLLLLMFVFLGRSLKPQRAFNIKDFVACFFLICLLFNSFRKMRTSLVLRFLESLF